MTYNIFYCCGTMLKKEDTCLERYPTKARRKKTKRDNRKRKLGKSKTKFCTLKTTGYKLYKLYCKRNLEVNYGK